MGAQPSPPEPDRVDQRIRTDDQETFQDAQDNNNIMDTGSSDMRMAVKRHGSRPGESTTSANESDSTNG